MIPHLCGLGIGRLTLLDRDVVEPRNFARQYLYRWEDIGATKSQQAAAWVRGFDPEIAVEAINAEVAGPEWLTELIGRLRPDAVVSGIDHPVDVDTWVNAACVRHRVPFVRAGMWVTQGMIRSVEPGRSACLVCAQTERDSQPAEDVERDSLALFGRKPRTNRAVGPVVGLLGALCAFEVLRFLTRFEEPAYTGSPLVVDFAGWCETRRLAWRRDPACPLCGEGR